MADSLEETHKQSVARLEVLKKSLNAAYDDNKDLEDTVLELQKKNDEITSNFQHKIKRLELLLQEERETAEEVAGKVETPDTSTSLSTAISDSKTELENIESQLKKELKKIQKEFADYKEIESEEIAALVEENVLLEDKLSEYEEAHKNFEAEHDEYLKILQTAKTTETDLRDELHQKAIELRNLRDKVFFCKNEYATEIAICHKTIETALAQNDIFKEMLAKEASVIEELKKKLAEEESVIEQLEDQLSKTNVKHADLSGKHNELLQEHGNLQDDYNILYDLYKDLEIKDEGLEALIDDLNEAIDEQDEVIDGLLTEKADLITKVDDLTKKCSLTESWYINELEVFQSKLEEAQNKVREFERKEDEWNSSFFGQAADSLRQIGIL